MRGRGRRRCLGKRSLLEKVSRMGASAEREERREYRATPPRQPFPSKLDRQAGSHTGEIRVSIFRTLRSPRRQVGRDNQHFIVPRRHQVWYASVAV